MSDMIYNDEKKTKKKPIVWQHGEVKTPPFSQTARLEACFLLRQLQKGLHVSMPASRPMPLIGERCHELRINDKHSHWRIVYRIDTDAILILEVFSKKTGTTPKTIIDMCKQRIRQYDSIAYAKGNP